MSDNKRKMIFYRMAVFTALLFLMLGSVWSGSLIASMRERLGTVGFDRIIANVRTNMDNYSSCYLTLDEMDDFAELTGSGSYTYRGVIKGSKTMAVYKNRSGAVKVYGTNADYQNFSGFQFLKGGYFTRLMEQEGRNSAVIGENLSMKLFNSTNVLGLEIKILNVDYVITGVYREDKSLISTLTNSGTGIVYVPYKSMEKNFNGTGIESFELQRSTAKGFIAKEDVSSKLSYIHKAAAAFEITDMTVSESVISRKPDIILFLAGMYVLWCLFVYFTIILRKLYFKLKESGDNKYFTGVLKENCLYILIFLAKTALLATAGFLIADKVRFSIYISSSSIPPVVFDIKYYANLAKSAIVVYIQNQGYTMSLFEVMAHNVNLAVDAAAVLCMAFSISGLLLARTVIRAGSVKINIYTEALIWTVCVLALYSLNMACYRDWQFDWLEALILGSFIILFVYKSSDIGFSLKSGVNSCNELTLQ